LAAVAVGLVAHIDAANGEQVEYDVGGRQL
jgi:hypothetical protein